MYKKILLLFFVFVFVIIAGNTFAQDIKPLAAKKDMDQLMEANKGSSFD